MATYAFRNAEGVYERFLLKRGYSALPSNCRMIGTLLELIGRTEKAKEFHRMCFKNVYTAVIDGHNIPGRSEENDIYCGRLLDKVHRKRINEPGDFIYFRLSRACFLRVLPGYSLDKSLFINFVSSLGP